MGRQIILLIPSLLLGLTMSAVGQQPPPQVDQESARDVHVQFAAAFNRQDAAGLAALFAENGLRVTPQGIIQGREAIQRDSEKRFQARFHDLSVTPLMVTVLSDSIWEA